MKKKKRKPDGEFRRNLNYSPHFLPDLPSFSVCTSTPEWLKQDKKGREKGRCWIHTEKGMRSDNKRGLISWEAAGRHRNKGKTGNFHQDGNSCSRIPWGVWLTLSLFPTGISAPKRADSCLWPNSSAALHQPLPKFSGKNADLSQRWIWSRIGDFPAWSIRSFLTFGIRTAHVGFPLAQEKKDQKWDSKIYSLEKM